MVYGRVEGWFRKGIEEFGFVYGGFGDGSGWDGRVYGWSRVWIGFVQAGLGVDLGLVQGGFHVWVRVG